MGSRRELERGDDRMAEIERLVLVLEVEPEGLFEVRESVIHRTALTRHINFKTARNEEFSFVCDRGCEFHMQSIRGRAVPGPWSNDPTRRTSGIQAVSVHIRVAGDETDALVQTVRSFAAGARGEINRFRTKFTRSIERRTIQQITHALPAR